MMLRCYCMNEAMHGGLDNPKIGTSALGQSLLHSLVRSHRSLIRLIRTACLARALRCAHSFARSHFTPKLTGKCNFDVHELGCSEPWCNGARWPLKKNPDPPPHKKKRYCGRPFYWSIDWEIPWILVEFGKHELIKNLVLNSPYLGFELTVAPV